MEYDVDIRLLSPAFLAAYPGTTYPELMHKGGRPYTCLLIDTHEDYLICIPFRSSINHKNAYLFTTTQRSIRTRSGLDYTKAVLIRDPSYIDSGHAIVDQDEYHETMANLKQITQEIDQYITTYANHVNGTAPLHLRAFQRQYGFSTLPYFHDIMGLP